MYRLIIFFLISLTSCSTTDSTTLEPSRYFDNKAWFEQEISRKKILNPPVEKWLQTGEDTTVLRSAIDDWNKELEIFADVDLNKAVYSGKLKVDTLFFAGDASDRMLIKYTALDSSINIRRFVMAKQFDRVMSLNALIVGRSPLLYSVVEWTYNPDQGYSLKGFQEMKGIRQNHFEVRARFIKGNAE